MLTIIAFLLLALVEVTAAQTPVPGSSPVCAGCQATYVSVDDVQTTIKKSIETKAADIEVINVNAGNFDFGIAVVTRLKGKYPNGGPAHDRVAEGYYMVAGSGELVTGGEFVAGKWTRTPCVDDSGSTTRGPIVPGTGVSHKMSKGDMIIIPGGVSHWWKEIYEDVTYATFRPDLDKKAKLRSRADWQKIMTECKANCGN